MSEKGFGYTKVTVEDGKGPPEVVRVEDDFCLITDGDMHVDGLQRYSNGTVVITIKKKE